MPSDGGNGGGKLHAPAVERNTQPILQVLRTVLSEYPQTNPRVLELASGSGQHAIAYSDAFPDLIWQPSERDPAGLDSIAAWRAEAGHDNLLEPVAIDLDDASWAERLDGPFGLIFASNLLHISPWSVTESLLAGAARILAPGGVLFVYGCFSRSGDFVSESNQAFDTSLRLRHPDWGVRDTDTVGSAAEKVGLTVEKIVPMPANNTVMVLRRA